MKRIIILMMLIAFLATGCQGAEKNTDDKAKEIINEDNIIVSQNVPPPKDYKVVYFEPKIYGCGWAIVSFEVVALMSGKEIPKEYDIQVSDNDRSVFHEKVDIADGKAYAVFENLNDSTEYTISISAIIDDKMKKCDETIEFMTPERSISLEDIDKYIQDEIDGQTGLKDSQVLLETQACLSLLGFESGRYGHFDPITQANLCQIEYSINRLDGYVNYDNIIAYPNNKTLKAMKDILSHDLNMTAVDFIQDFVPADYTLSEYAVLDETGGKLDIEAYILDITKDNYALRQIYNEYPFDTETDEFKNLYKEEYEKDWPEESLEYKLNQLAAKNKAQFSKNAEDFLIMIAKPGQRLVVLAGTDNELTINAIIAYSYLFMDAYRSTGEQFTASTTYRDYEFQWDLYSKGAGKAVANGRNSSWHYDRQVYSYVPGFSNHQYGVAIDFHDRKTFLDTNLYKFLNKNGYKYGFYNYLIEPWHWMYLGDMK